MTHRMPRVDTPDNVETVVLRPGDFHFGRGNTRISTLLGSCVSLTLWHARMRIGGMCHYMMAERDQRTEPAGHEPDGRYATEAFALFLRHIEKAATRPSEYQAKLFGGGNMFIEQQTLNTMNVAIKNIKAAWQLTQHLGLTIKAHHLGHAGHRSLIFELASGNVWVRHHRLPHR